MADVQRLLSEQEVAEKLGVSPESVRHWRYRGLLGFVRLGRKPMYRAADLEKFIRSNEVAPLRVVGRS